MKSDRRALLRAGLGAALTMPLLGRGGQARAAASDERPRRLLQIFLTGGWDSALATDPVIGEKATSGAYDPYYTAQPIRTVPGKDRLVVGGGLLPALPAFQAVPTAFVNGLHVEVTAHELASQYVLTGISSLGLNDRIPSYIARMAAASGRFPSHVVLGQIPLGETKTTAPPLQAAHIHGISEMLRAPGEGWYTDSMRQVSYDLTRTLDELRYGTKLESRSKALTAWRTADRALPGLYARGFGTKLDPSKELFARYGASEAGGLTGHIAGCFLVLKSNLSRLVTTTAGDFDTHLEMAPKQINQLKELATALNALVADLRATPDSDLPGASLMDTTTIVVTSEFVRTPNRAKSGGTDHWQSASAIVMGQGVRDNVVIGATDREAHALGWDGKPSPFHAASRIAPEHFAAAVMRNGGFAKQADEVCQQPLAGLFS